MYKAPDFPCNSGHTLSPGDSYNIENNFPTHRHVALCPLALQFMALRQTYPYSGRTSQPLDHSKPLLTAD